MSRNWPYSPGDTIKSANDNDDKEGLASGDNDYDNNSLFVFRKESFDTFFAKDGCLWSVVSGLTATMSSGFIYPASTGDRTSVSGVGSNVFSASQDTYVFINEQTGVISYSTTSVGGAAPAPGANQILNAIVTTNASSVVGIAQSGFSTNNDPVHNTNPKIESAAAKTRTIVSATTISPVTDRSNIYIVSSLASTAAIGAPSGSPEDGQGLMIRIRDDGSARALSWASAYRQVGVTLPTTTVANKLLYVSLRYNAIDGRWDALSVGRE